VSMCSTCPECGQCDYYDEETGETDVEACAADKNDAACERVEGMRE